MQHGMVDMVITGADRVTRNGDVANKIGTYMVAVLAKRHGIPFYVAAPLSTVDLNTPTGDEIPIEERDRIEVTHVKEGDDVMVTWVPRDGEHASRRPDGVDLQLADGSIAKTTSSFTWADVTVADEQYVVRTPGSHKKDVTAVIGCAVMTGAGAVYYTAGVQKGQSVAIFGVGGVGLSAIAAAISMTRSWRSR